MLREALGHHAWATRQLLDHCGSLPPETLERPVEAIYGSVLDTFRHLVDADADYLRQLSDGELGESLADASALSFAEVVALADRNAGHWELLVARSPDPDTVIERMWPDGWWTAATVGVRIAQAVHHGSDHRSQIATALTLLGHPAGEFDVWAWGETVGLSRETPPPDG